MANMFPSSPALPRSIVRTETTRENWMGGGFSYLGEEEEGSLVVVVS